VHDLLSGDAGEAARRALADPPLIAELLDGMRSDDAGLRARAATAAEQAARERPELLAPHADTLIEIAANAGEDAVRVAAAQMLARVEVSEERAGQASDVLERYLASDDRAVEAWALSAIVALANEHASLRPRARELVHARTDSDAEPVRTRAALLLDQADSWPGSAGGSS
jgi:hypothetical protein